MKILLSAFACDPNSGSEPYVGWNWLKLLSARHSKLTVLTRRVHQEVLQQTIEKNQMRNVEFIFFDLPVIGGMGHRDRGIKAYYIAWQVLAYFRVLAYCLTNRVKVIHHCTYNVVDFPGFLWAIPGSRFVWGPVGGGQCPPEWASRIYGSGWNRERLRRFIKATIRYNPLVLLGIWRASVVLVANDETLARIPERFRGKCQKMLETAINVPPGRAARSADGASGQAVRLLWVGQIERRKAVGILLDAISALSLRRGGTDGITVDVIGEGPDMQREIQRAEKLGIRSAVNFLGAQPFHKMSDFYARADMFVFTSVQDTSGNVVLEALSHGLPVVAINHQGAKEILRDGGGLLVEPEDYGTVVEGFSQYIEAALDGKLDLHGLSEAGLKNISLNHSWGRKGEDIRVIYDEIFS